MIRHQLRRLTAATLVALIALGAAPAVADEDEPTITFFGGGFGHGIGMSQYGAFNMADQGFTYDEILAFYYADTELESVDGFGDFGDNDDVDVLITGPGDQYTRSVIAVSRPLVEGAPEPDWEITLSADGEEIATADDSVRATYDSGWSVTLDGDELCDERCNDVALAFVVTGGTHLVLEADLDSTNLGQPTGGKSGAYSGAEILLYPGALGGGCGGATSFCAIHSGLDLQDYVKGIAEIPVSWPEHAQRAQAVAARSYAASAILRRVGNGKAYDVVDTTADQYYVGYYRRSACGNWCGAIDATDNEVLVHEATGIAETFYSASNGGHTAEPPDVWSGGTTRPYLVATPDPYDAHDDNPYAAREYVYSVADVSEWLNDYHLSYPEAGDQLQVGTVRSIDIDAPPSGRVSFATVTIVGSEKTSVVYKVPGDPSEPYGFRFYNALKQGCQNTQGCEAMRSTNFAVLESIPFTDVDYDDYFYLPVLWMTLEDITTGVDPTTFGSEDPNSRAQLATFIWRFAGEPEPTEPHGFTDVVVDSFYEDAVAWMKANEITTGTSPTEFSPEGNVSRAEAAAFLWRFAGSPGSEHPHSFTDVPENTYYTDAVRWMVEWDITTGTLPTTFSPNDTVTRAQIATFLYRLAGAPGAFAEGIELPAAMRDA